MKTKLDETYIFEIKINSDSLMLDSSIKIPLLRVSVAFEPGRSLLTVRYNELFDTPSKRLPDQMTLLPFWTFQAA